MELVGLIVGILGLFVSACGVWYAHQIYERQRQDGINVWRPVANYLTEIGEKVGLDNKLTVTENGRVTRLVVVKIQPMKSTMGVATDIQILTGQRKHPKELE